MMYTEAYLFFAVVKIALSRAILFPSFLLKLPVLAGDFDLQYLTYVRLTWCGMVTLVTGIQAEKTHLLEYDVVKFEKDI